MRHYNKERFYQHPNRKLRSYTLDLSWMLAVNLQRSYKDTQVSEHCAF